MDLHYARLLMAVLGELPNVPSTHIGQMRGLGGRGTWRTSGMRVQLDLFTAVQNLPGIPNQSFGVSTPNCQLLVISPSARSSTHYIRKAISDATDAKS